MTKWEYKVKDYNGEYSTQISQNLFTENALTAMLDEQGLEGWELVNFYATSSFFRAIFKRPYAI